MRLLNRTIILLILLAATALRLYHLDFQSFWSDEGISLNRSAIPLDEMLGSMPVEHMPGYFIMLHYWLRLVGSSDYAVRFLSAWPSILAVALLYRLNLDVASRTTIESQSGSVSRVHKLSSSRRGAATGPPPFALFSSCTSAAVLATAVFQVWYAQEARMYSWLLAAGLSSHLLFWRLFRQEKRRHAAVLPDALLVAGYVASTTLSIYLHFYGFLVPLIHAVYASIWILVTRRWRPFAAWAGAGFAVLLLFLPWLARALQIFGFSGWRDPADPWALPRLYFAAYTVGDALQPPWRSPLLWIYFGLCLVGVWAWIRHERAAGYFLLSAVLIPIVFVFLLALSNPDYHERYAIIVSPIIALLVGGGIGFIGAASRSPGQSQRADSGSSRSASGGTSWAMSRSWMKALVALAAIVILLAGNGIALARHYSDATLHKPDFREAAWRIARGERAGDVVLVDGPDPQKVFLRYYRDEFQGEAPVVDLRDLEGKSWEAIDERLRSLTTGAERIWELLYFHEPGPVQIWTAINAWATEPTNHNDIRVTLYGLAREAAAATRHEFQMPFAPGLKLEAAEINRDRFGTGDIIQVTTTWSVEAPLPDYKFSLRLQREDGTVVLARDYVPQNWFAPTSTWVVGQRAVDKHGLLLPDSTSSGSYVVTLRLYDGATGIPVETDAGQDLWLGQVEVHAEE